MATFRDLPKWVERADGTRVPKTAEPVPTSDFTAFFADAGLGLTPEPVEPVPCPVCGSPMEVHTKVPSGGTRVTVTPFVGACTGCEFIHVFTV